MPGSTTDEIQREMERKHAAGAAYTMGLPWDHRRHNALVESMVELMWHPDGDATSPEWKGLNGRVFDVGCGASGTCAFVPPENQHNFVGVEISESACKKARTSFPAATFVASPAERYEPDGTFDLVNCVEAIEHWLPSETPGILATMRKAMRPDSRLVMTTPNHDSLHHRIGRKLGSNVPYCCAAEHIHEYGFDELISFMRAHGFEVVRSKGVMLMAWWALPEHFGCAVQSITDNDWEVLEWIYELGRDCHPKYAFGQLHSFRLA